MARTCPGAALGLLLAMALAVQAEETYSLQTEDRVNEIVVVNTRLELEMTMPTVAQAQAQASPSTDRYRAAQVSEIRYRTLKVRDGRAVCRRAFVVIAEETEAMPGGKPARTTSPLAGKVIVMTLHPGGKTTYATSRGKPVDPGEGDRWLEGMSGLVEKQIEAHLASIQIGQEVALTPEETAALLAGLAPGAQGDVRVKLVDVSEKRGRQVADIEVGIKVTGDVTSDERVALDLKLKLLWDIDGRAQSFMDMGGTIRVFIKGKEGEADTASAEGALKARMVWTPIPR